MKFSEISKINFVNLLLGGKSTDFEKTRKRNGVVAPFIIGVPILFGYATFQLFHADYFNGFKNLIVGVFLIICLAAFRFLKNDLVIYRTIVFLLSALFLLDLVKGGPHGSMIDWMYILPIVAYFLFGTKEGLAWSFTFFTLAMVFLLNPDSFFRAYPYGTDVSAEFLLSFFVLIVMIHTYESVRQKVQITLSKEKINLAQINSFLARLKKAIEHSQDGIAVTGSDGCIEFVNPAWAEMHGYNVDELIGKNILISHTSEQVKKDIPFIIDQIKKKGSFICEVDRVRKNGDIFPSWMSINSITDNNKKSSGLIVVIRDITERNLMENELMWQKKFLENAIKALNHPFYVLDTDTYEVLVANTAAAGNGHATGITCFAMIYHENSPCNTADRPCPLKTIMKTKKTVIVEHIRYDLDGNPRNIEIHANPVLDQAGNVVQMIEYQIDITDHKHAAEKLKRKNSELEIFNRLAVDREIKMVELKKEINRLAQEAGQEPRYNIAE